MIDAETKHEPEWVLQLVGFTTELRADEFALRWEPFARRFKDLGIATIDLYHVTRGAKLAFMSRNLWLRSDYFRVFPSGLASPGGGPGISVTQLGGYWAPVPVAGAAPAPTIDVLFAHDAEVTDPGSACAGSAVSEAVPFRRVLQGAGRASAEIGDRDVRVEGVLIRRF